MSTCRRCNRPLKREPWATLGIGSVCSKKENVSLDNKQQEGDTDTIVPYDGGDFFIERKTTPFISRHFGGQMRQEGTDHASGVTTNVQRTIYRHSPTGFNFGYGGSGPSDFALNLLRMVTKPTITDSLYMAFKFEFVTKDGNRLDFKRTDVESWIQSKLAEMAFNEIKANNEQHQLPLR